MADIRLLQIGTEDWSHTLEIPSNMTWFYTEEEGIADLLEELKEAELAKISPEKLASLEEPPSISISFSALLVTSSLSEASLEVLTKAVEAHAVFTDSQVVIYDQEERGFCRRKLVRPLPSAGTRKEKVDYLALNLFSGQYGAKHKLPEIDIHPLFEGRVDYQGNVGVTLSGQFGKTFQPLLAFRYNLPTFPCALEIWPEYIKEGDCQLRVEIDLIQKGSTTDIIGRLVLSEEDLQEPYILEKNDAVGFYALSISARGQGSLTLGALHWRYSRTGLGQFVLGGQRYADHKRQETFYYFNPGDMKPPLNVYFSGFRGAEGFEGFYMMKSKGAPFVLIADPRLEGGCFYLGTEEYENNVKRAIQESLDYLGFSRDQLILSGLSMGAFGALYYAAHFTPHAVIVGKPFTDLGDTVAGLKLLRPDEFETSGDMIRNVIGGTDAEARAAFNSRFWQVFSQSDFSRTQFAIAYMEQDDYDRHAIERIIDHMAEADVAIRTKGYEGRHNDNSRAINRWFGSQYQKILTHDFGRGSS